MGRANAAKFTNLHITHERDQTRDQPFMHVIKHEIGPCIDPYTIRVEITMLYLLRGKPQDFQFP